MSFTTHTAQVARFARTLNEVPQVTFTAEAWAANKSAAPSGKPSGYREKRNAVTGRMDLEVRINGEWVKK